VVGAGTVLLTEEIFLNHHHPHRPQKKRWGKKRRQRQKEWRWRRVERKHPFQRAHIRA